MLHKSNLNVECKNVELQMTNTKCTIHCAKYNVTWNIEFWLKWNAIAREELVGNDDVSFVRASK